MRLKRFLMAAVLPVLVAGPALAATCLQPAERQAMEARALRSYLMVTAPKAI
jgi:opacity protein-like surface antigen